MSKSMMGSAGGGKVTVEGLDADVVLAGNTIKVLQGAKEILSVEGSAEFEFLGAGFRYAMFQNYNVGDTIQRSNDFLNSVAVPSGSQASTSFAFKKDCSVKIFWKGTSQGSPTTLKLNGVNVESGQTYEAKAGQAIRIYLGPTGGSTASVFYTIYKVG